MSIEALSVLTYGLLIFVMIIIQGVYLTKTAGAAYNMSNRYGDTPNKGKLGHRIDKALQNTKEGAVMYAPLALLAVHYEISNGWTYYAALAVILSRILYIPVYIIGIEKVWSLVWMPGFFAVPCMAYGLFAALNG